MIYRSIPIKKRIQENIKNYSLEQLISMEQMKALLQSVSDMFHINILLTERHGESIFSVGDCKNYIPDVVKAPGLKIKVFNRTIGHLYVLTDGMEAEKSQYPATCLENIVQVFNTWAEEAYQKKELAIYLDELEEQIEKEYFHIKYGEKEDALTGMLNRTSFENRLRVMERLELVPAYIICGNINDWKYVNDHYGEEESDRLIQIIASIMKEEAKTNYVIGRVDGDVFHVVIPLAGDEEAEEYCERVQARCLAYEDDKLSPSIAFGIGIKTNVEEHYIDLFSEAEYEMFQNKMALKNVSGYRERLEKYS